MHGHLAFFLLVQQILPYPIYVCVIDVDSGPIPIPISALARFASLCPFLAANIIFTYLSLYT